MGLELSEKIILPLTAGLDSRVILSKLIKSKYKNFSTFTHETNGLDDIKTATFKTETINYLTII
ncbi:MAG TPA: hypothetical protein DHM37_04425 [Candidatus Cloacimonas sp.]|nr:hypothetical protein [Candidatus Cloacimonadota bacterium]HCX72946.1 hypothetical protein [Candidatus Cloacimonas sp.]